MKTEHAVLPKAKGVLYYGALKQTQNSSSEEILKLIEQQAYHTQYQNGLTYQAKDNPSFLSAAGTVEKKNRKLEVRGRVDLPA